MEGKRMQQDMQIFLSTHSVRSATNLCLAEGFNYKEFLSTHSVRSATVIQTLAKYKLLISIHALRKECDVEIVKRIVDDELISIHALRKECDIALINADMPFCKFLSTHSVRSATLFGNTLSNI